MTIPLKIRRGTTTQHASFTGLVAEITVDTDKNVLVVHDGVTAAGHEVARQDHTHTDYTHSSGEGSNHIPSGGSTYKILRWVAPGEAVWGDDTDTVYVHPTGDGNLHVPQNGTGNNGKILTATHVAGVLIWQTVPSALVSSVAGKTGVVVLVKADVGLGSVDNTTDASKPVSTAVQTALNLKSNKNSPAFTGTPTGISKANVGLSNVDNTTDAAKPVSTATQTALALKSNKNSPAFTGTPTGITNVHVGLPKVDNIAISSGTAAPSGGADGDIYIKHS